MPNEDDSFLKKKGSEENSNQKLDNDDNQSSTSSSSEHKLKIDIDEDTDSNNKITTENTTQNEIMDTTVSEQVISSWLFI